MAEIEKATEEVFRKEEKTGKKVSLYLSHRYSGMKLKEIGEYFGISESGVTQASRPLGKKIEEDKNLKKKVTLTKSKKKKKRERYHNWEYSHGTGNSPFVLDNGRDYRGGRYYPKPRRCFG